LIAQRTDITIKACFFRFLPIWGFEILARIGDRPIVVTVYSSQDTTPELVLVSFRKELSVNLESILVAAKALRKANYLTNQIQAIAKISSP